MGLLIDKDYEDISPSKDVAEATWEDVEEAPDLSPNADKWEDVEGLPSFLPPVETDFEAEPEPTSVWDALAGGFKQDLTFSFGDEASGLMTSLWASPEDEDVFGETYRAMRDDNRRYQQQLDDEHGTAYFLGGLAGSVAVTAAIIAATAATVGTGGAAAVPIGAIGSVATGAAARSAAKTAAKKAMQFAAHGAKVGSVEGAVHGLGMSQAEIAQGEVGQAVRDSAKMALVGGVMGAGLGVGLQGVGFVGGKGVEKLGKKFGKKLDDNPMSVDVIDVAENWAQMDKAGNDSISRLYTGDVDNIVEAMKGTDSRWASTLAKDELDSIGAMAGMKSSPDLGKESLSEYYGSYLRQDMTGFLNHVGIKTNIPQPKFSKKTQEWDWPGEPAMRQALDQASKEGKLTPELYSEYRRSAYMVDAAKAFSDHEYQKILLDRVGKETGTKKYQESLESLVKDGAFLDPFKGYIGAFNRKVMNPFVHAGRVDRQTGIDLEGAMYRAVQNDQLAANYTYLLRDPIKKLEKKARSHPTYDKADNITRDIERGIKHEILDEPRRLLKEAKEFLDQQGFKFASRGEDYVPHLKKRGSAYLQAMINQGKKVLPQLDDMTATQQDKLFHSVGQLHLGKRDDLRMFIHELNQHHGKNVKNRLELEESLGNLTSKPSVKKSLAREVSFAKTREGETPEWLREQNIYKLLYQYHNLVGDTVFRQKSARELTGIQSILSNQFKMSESSSWLGNFVKDYTGQWRDIFSNKAMLMKTNMEMYLQNKPALMALFEMSDLFGRAIYPNMLGMNVRAVARNLTQPWVMTLPEAGWSNMDHMMKSYSKLMSPKHFKATKEELFKKGYAKRFYSEEDANTTRNALVEGYSSKGIRLAKDIVDKQSEIVMYAYKESDTWNRAITLQFTKELAAEIIADPKTLNKFQGHVSPGTLRNMRRALAKNDPQGAQDAFTDYFMAKTQLIYGKVGMHEFGRDMGPYFSMFTAWPSYVYSDIFDKLSQKQFTKVAGKYIAPYMVGSMMTSAWMPEGKRNRRMEELVGRGGFQATVPLNSIMGVGDIFGHKLLKTGLEGVDDLLRNVGPALEGNEKAQEAMWRRGGRMRDVFIPMGGIPRQAEHLYYLFGPEGSRSAQSTRK